MCPHSAILELLSIIILIFPEEENEAVRLTNLPRVTESRLWQIQIHDEDLSQPCSVAVQPLCFSLSLLISEFLKQKEDYFCPNCWNPSFTISAPSQEWDDYGGQ